MTIFDDIRKDANRSARNPNTDWIVDTDGPAPGWVEVKGPVIKVSSPTVATNLNGEDYTDRHKDARRIARVPQLERIALAAEELAGAMKQQESYNGGISINVKMAMAAFREATK